MDMVLQKLWWECALVYLDNVNIYSLDFNSHLTDLTNIFSRLRTPWLKFKAKNCVIGLPKLTYLGHVVSAAGLRPDPAKIQVVSQLKNSHQLGMYTILHRINKSLPTLCQGFRRHRGTPLQIHKKEGCFYLGDGRAICLWEIEGRPMLGSLTHIPSLRLTIYTADGH